MEILLIALFCALIFLPTLNFSCIVDDVRWADEIYKGMFAQFKGHKWWNLLRYRLYGIGTFARLEECGDCKGLRTITRYIENKLESVPCKNCQATGRAWFIDFKLERWVTIGLHALVCILIYLALGHNQTSLIASLLYAVNPTNAQTSVWYNGRRYVISLIIMLLMILAGPLGAALYLLIPMFQISAIFSPVVFGWLGVPLVALVVALKWEMIQHKMRERFKAIVNKDMTTWHWGRATVIVKTFGFYMMQMLLPRRNFMVYKFIAEWGLNEKGNNEAYRRDVYFYLGIGFLGVFSYLALTLTGAERLWLILAFLSLAQQCNVVPATQTIADRYCSVPIIFVMYFAAKFAGPVGSTILGIYYLTSLYSALPLFRNMKSYYDYHLYHNPDDVIVRKFMANWLLRVDDIVGALHILRDGLKRNPDDFSLNYQAAICMGKMGDAKMFHHYLAKAEANHYLNQDKLWQPHLDDLKTKMPMETTVNRIAPRHMTKQEFAKRMK